MRKAVAAPDTRPLSAISQGRSGIAVIVMALMLKT